MMRSGIALGLGVLVLMVLMGVLFLVQDKDTVPQDPWGNAGATLRGLDATARRGLAVYQDNGCASCHVLAGVGAPGPGPDLTRLGTRRGDAAALAALLRDPKAPMPSYASLPAADLTALATLLAGLGTRHVVP